MINPKYYELIELMLKKHRPDYNDPHVQLAWERGYLTGLLASLASNDTFVSSAIRARLKNKD